MRKIFKDIQIEGNQYNKLYSLFNSVRKTPDNIHNLTIPKVTIPIQYKVLLALGLKFSIPTYPNFEILSKQFNESIRKVSWNLFFRATQEDDNNKKCDPFDRYVIESKKRKRLIDKEIPSACEFQSVIFPNSSMTENFCDLIKSNSSEPHFIPKNLLLELKNFKTVNNIVIKEADKNAGICFMFQSDYDKEIFTQLDDLNFYFPSTKSQYNLSVLEFVDKIKILDKSLNNDTKLNSLIPINHKPAKFYILPKVHKKFETFPKGRPISSTVSTINSNISKLVDFILQPMMNYVPDIILDSTHFLILLNNVQLNPTRKYALVTIDIAAMYTNLPIHYVKDTVVRPLLNLKINVIYTLILLTVSLNNY